MSIVQFASICDICDARSEEYSKFPSCRDCGADVCELHVVPQSLDEERGKCLCTMCDRVESYTMHVAHYWINDKCVKCGVSFTEDNEGELCKVKIN